MKFNSTHIILIGLVIWTISSLAVILIKHQEAKGLRAEVNALKAVSDLLLQEEIDFCEEYGITKMMGLTCATYQDNSLACAPIHHGDEGIDLGFKLPFMNQSTNFLVCNYSLTHRQLLNCEPIQGNSTK